MILFIKKYYYIFFIIVFSLSFASQKIKIKAPKGKEKIKIGSNYEIKWKTKKNISNDEKIKILISFDEGNEWNLIAITENDGLYNWNVPAINSKKCLINSYPFHLSCYCLYSFTSKYKALKIIK